MQRRLLVSVCVLILSALIVSGLAADPVHAASPGTYTVQPGDTLIGIATRHGLNASQLARANGLHQNSWVYVGQRLTIPGAGPISPANYIVRRGDTLSHIAHCYGTTVQAILAANNLRSTTIYVGQRLVIPGHDVVPGYNAAAAERIRFAPGATQTTVEGNLPANDSRFYVMRVAAGQFIEVSATVGATGQGMRFSIIGADGVVVKTMGEAHVRTVVPSTQDYYVELVSDLGVVSYRMSVLIPVRIRFASGATSAKVSGGLVANGMRHYVLHALAGQRMIVVRRTIQGQVGLVIWGADGHVLLSGRVAVADGGYDGILPATQDYIIAVRSEDGIRADYILDITIPSL